MTGEFYIDDLGIPEIETLGQLLENRRKGKRLSRAQLAEMTSIPAISIAKYEKAGEPGGQYPPVKKLAKLAKALGIDGHMVLATCFDTDEELEEWWAFQKTDGTELLAKILMSALTENKAQVRQLAEFFLKAANEKPEEASLATSSPGSEPKPNPHVKENEDGSS